MLKKRFKYEFCTIFYLICLPCDKNITQMWTTSIGDFIRYYLQISNKLTSTEMQMLYLLITEPEVIELSQQEFAKKLNTHRRTINIGLKNLKKHKYITDIYFHEEEKSNEDYLKIHGEKKVTKGAEAFAKKFVIDTYNMFYERIDKESVVVNEDFYGLILGNVKLIENLRYNKKYITETIRHSFPDCKFYFELKKSSYVSDIDYYINKKINREILNARTHKRYYLLKDKLLKDLYESYSIYEEEVFKDIKQSFPKFVTVGNRIRLPKPWKPSSRGY
jgi:hypothetical protein